MFGNLTSYDKVFEKFFSSFARVEDNRTDFERFRSLLRFISSLRERQIINDEQVERLIRHAAAVLLENQIEIGFGRALKRLEEGFEFDREKQEW